MSKSSISKTAVDSAAEKYWTDYFKDTGYGKLWVRKIPRKVKAELSRLDKTAAKGTEAVYDIRPIAHVVTDSGMSLEAIAVMGQNRVAFVIDFNHDGDVVGFDTVGA